jgi:hypothetical protein
MMNFTQYYILRNSSQSSVLSYLQPLSSAPSNHFCQAVVFSFLDNLRSIPPNSIPLLSLMTHDKRSFGVGGRMTYDAFN